MGERIELEVLMELKKQGVAMSTLMICEGGEGNIEAIS